MCFNFKVCSHYCFICFVFHSGNICVMFYALTYFIPLFYFCYSFKLFVSFTLFLCCYEKVNYMILLDLYYICLVFFEIILFSRSLFPSV